MKKGKERFEYFLNQIQSLFDTAAKQKNPALWLYQNNARSLLFMLEGLAKLYADLHNKNKFSRLKKEFKLLEDAIGSIDYYSAFVKENGKNKKIPLPVIKYLDKQQMKKIQTLNELLKKKQWLTHPQKKISKIKKQLNNANWLKSKDEIKGISKIYEKTNKEITSFVNETGFYFDNVEADVHELRRKLRWLSIYPQALRGCIQLIKNKAKLKHLNKYLTPAITSSPYNIMPDAGNNRHFLLLEKEYFYALSWLIAELGKLKDSGLKILILKEALEQTFDITGKTADKKINQWLGNKQPSLQQILADATSMCEKYFKEKNIEHLVVGAAQVKDR